MAKKVEATDAKVVPGRAQRALKKGPHSKAIHANGSSQADANQHMDDGKRPGKTRGY